MKLPFGKKCLISLLIAIALLLALIFGLSFGLQHHDLTGGAVVANGIGCAEFGTDILKKGGSAADAVIATLFCEGIVCAQSMGLGGGFLLTIYQKSTGKVETLIAREMAPKAATFDMFVNRTVEGVLAIAIPGEIKGYWELHMKYGKLPWKDLVQPSIELSRNGHMVSPFMAKVLKSNEESIKNSPTMAEVYINPETGAVWREGDRVKRPKLAETLEIIATEGANAIYNISGTVGQNIVKDLQSLGGIITIDDFVDYKVKWEKPVVSIFPEGKIMYTIPLPGSGPLLAFIMNILNNFSLDRSIASFQTMVESFKYAFARRSELGDSVYSESAKNVVENITNMEYALYSKSLISTNRTYHDYQHYGANFTIMPEDHGTAHVSVIAPNGDAISVTSTVNNYFGSKIRSVSTGIIFNDQMDDFSTPGITNSFGVPSSPANYIQPGKRPLSSMCPTIITNKNGDVQLLIGGAGGTKITTSVAYAIIRHLQFNESLSAAVYAKRLHHQLAPMELQYEHGFDQNIIQGLVNIGHVVKELSPDDGFAALTTLAWENGKLSGVFDPRRGGSISIF